MSTTTTKPQKLNVKEHTKAALIRNVLYANIDASEREIREFYGGKVQLGSGHISMVRQALRRKQIREEAQTTLFDGEKTKTKTKVKKKAKKTAEETKATPTATATPASTSLPPIDVAALHDENRYLRWQLVGERQGYFERWLEETNDG
jgi:hypothetical protein